MLNKRILHIVETDFLADGEMIVRFSDGTSAIYPCEELEKLRPRSRELEMARKIA